ncbi:MAG: type II toxin-antitoxin system Phd/YefM family antitoxin [Candidatus Anammoxibacter sp.]
MLEFFRNVEKTGEELIVAGNNKPVLKILLYKKKTHYDELLADLHGKIKGDINEPALKQEEWNLNSFKKDIF